MAVCWIEKIVNDHPTGTLLLNCADFSRHPRVKGTSQEFGRNDWFSVGPGETLELENFAIPWSHNFFREQALFVKTILPEQQYTYVYRIVNHDAWDWVSIKDDNLQGPQLGEVEVGSMGDAPLINHSAWHLALTTNGVEWRNQWRQGIPRDAFLPLIEFGEDSYRKIALFFNPPPRSSKYYAVAEQETD
jgi:hypothetical protein